MFKMTNGSNKRKGNAALPNGTREDGQNRERNRRLISCALRLFAHTQSGRALNICSVEKLAIECPAAKGPANLTFP